MWTISSRQLLENFGFIANRDRSEALASQLCHNISTRFYFSLMTEKRMKAIEVLGTVNEQGQLFLDVPLSIDEHTRVKVVVLIPEDSDRKDK